MNSPSVKNDYQASRRYFVSIKRITQTTKIRSFTWLSVTIFTITFFLIVAIRPTLVTIAKLNKEIKDKTQASKELQKKIDSIVAAQDIYARNSDNLTLLDEAFPEKSEFPRLAFFFEQIATSSGVVLKNLGFERIEDVNLKAKDTSSSLALPLNFSVLTNSDYLKLKAFLKESESSRRILKIEAATFSLIKKEDSFELQLSITGQASFRKRS